MTGSGNPSSTRPFPSGTPPGPSAARSSSTRRSRSGWRKRGRSGSRPPFWSWPRTPSSSATRTKRSPIWNHGAEVIYGWTKAEAVSRGITAFLRTKIPRTLARIADLVMKEGHWEGELVHVDEGRPDDRRREPLGDARRQGREARRASSRSTGTSPRARASRRPSGAPPSIPGASSKPASIPSWPSARPGRSPT